MNVKISDFRPMERNTLQGFATVTLPDMGMTIHDVAVHQRDGRAWASPPGRPMIGRDGTQMRDAAGKAQFSPTVSFASRADQDAFSNAVLAALRQSHPTALGGGR